MITISMSAVIGAARGRVWRALTISSERAGWDDQVIALLDDASQYPQVGQHIRWRYRLGTVSILLHDRPIEVVPEDRLRSEIALGLFHFEETYTLGDDGDPERTRLSLRVAASNSVPVVGGLLDRFAVRRLASDFVDGRLRAVQKWCENPAAESG